jgi:zinc protease
MLRRLPIALLLASCAHAQIADLAVERVTLPNGMELLLHPDHKAPIVHLSFHFRVGSKHEEPGQYGLAHLFEHLIYENRDGTPISTAAEQMGATTLNGATKEDFTEFYETVPASRLERMLWMASNQFALFPRNLTQQNLDRQREVVINEKRLRVENEAYSRVGMIVREQAFPSGHPYQHGVGGEYADLRSITLDQVRAFYAKHYTPDQSTLALVGDFDPAQAKQWVAKYFGSLAPGDGLVGPPRSAPPLAAPKFIQIEERVRVERVWFAWVGPSMDHRDDAALEFAALMLTDEHSPRLLQHPLGDKLSLGVSIDRQDFQDASLFYIYVSVVPGASVAAIDQKLASELSRLARDGPTAAEMERTRNKLESDRLGELESISGMASVLHQVHHFYGSIGRWNDWSARYSSISPDDVRAAVNRWLVTPSHLTVDVRPQIAVQNDTAELDRTTPPPFQPEKPYSAPEIQTAKLPNGLEILVLERHDLPKVAVRVQFRAGTIASPPDKPALMLLTASAGKGTPTRKDDGVERALADLGTSLGGDADFNAQDYRFEVLRKNLDPAFRIFADGMLHTEYPNWLVEERKKAWIEEIEKPEASLDNFSSAMFASAFGPDHPLGKSLGTVDSIRSLTAADARELHDRYWKPGIAAVIFAGDITLKEAVALATETLGSWSGTPPPVPKMPPPAPKHGRFVFVDRKGVTQTMVVQVLAGVPRDHPDYPALFLADRIYGGMSSSRIWENIRQQHGIAYYAHSELSHFSSLGLWVILSPVQVDSTALAMREFDKELSAFGRSKPITQVELDQARNGFIRLLPEQLETLGSAAATIAANWSWGLPIDDIRMFPQRLASVTIDDVNAVARKYARTDQAFFVLVGDRQKIEPQLSDFR